LHRLGDDYHFSNAFAAIGKSVDRYVLEAQLDPYNGKRFSPKPLILKERKG